MSFTAVLHLVSAGIRARLGRFVAASVAIALASAVLLAALISRQLVRDQAPRAAQALLGPKELHLAATDTVHPYIDEGLLEAMRADPRVARLTTAMTVRAVDMPGLESGEFDEETFYSLGADGMGGWIAGRRDSFVAWEEGGPCGELVAGRWPSPTSTDPIEVAAPVVFWDQRVDAWRRLESDTGVHRAHVVGMIKANPAMVATDEGRRLTSRQISRAAAEALAGGPRPPSDARLVLHRADDKAAFLKEWKGRVASSAGRLELWDNATIHRAGLDSPAAESARLAVQSAAMLAAACVVCIALSVQGNAVRERAAQLTLLRSLGAGRATLIATVLAEAYALAAAGLIGAVALVMAGMTGVAALAPMLQAPAAPDAMSVALAGEVIFLGVLAGGSWPAYVASRARPGDVVPYEADPSRAARFARWAAVGGGAVAALTAASLFAAPPGSMARAATITWVGVPGLALATVLLTPLTIRAACRLFVRPVAWLTRTDPIVLADQVASDGARSAGSVIAVAVGLGGFVWMMCWGASMLECFIIDSNAPRWLVSIHPYGLSRAETERLLADPALRDYQPLTLIDTHLADSTSDPEPTLVMGVDIHRALGNGARSLPLQVLDGDCTQAAVELEGGDACLVSSWYAASHGVKVGDRIAVAAPGGRAQRAYRVVGVVKLRGWRMMTKQNKARLAGEKHRVMVVLDADVARRDFPVAYANFLLGDPAPDASGNVPGYRGDLPKEEAHAASRAEREAVEDAVAAAVDLSQPIEHTPDGVTRVRAEQRVVQVDDLDRTRNALRGEWGGAAVKRMGSIPLFVLALSLLSVSGTLVVSLRSRARELGVLRSCGMTRLGLARLSLAEGLLLGLAAAPVAAMLGGVGAWLMLEVASLVGWRLDFAGIQPEFIVPWQWLWPGAAMTITVCCLAALWAAWRVGRVPPATLVTGAAPRQ